MTNLSSAVGDVRRFVAGSRDQTAEQIQRLANVTQNLVDHKLDLENMLHVAPNAIANGYNIYNPDTGAHRRAVRVEQLLQSDAVLCDAIAAVDERHVGRDSETVRAEPRSRAATRSASTTCRSRSTRT